MKLTIITDPEKLVYLGWGPFVEAHPEGTVFQSPEMHELFLGTGRMKPVVVGLTDEASGSVKGILMAVIIRELSGLAGYFSSRTVIYGGPLIDPSAGDRLEMLRLLLDRLIREVKNHSIFIQFRNFSSQEDGLGAFKDAGFHFRDRLNLIVDTSSRKTVIKNMSASRWRQVKKGLGIGKLDSRAVGQLDSRAVGQLDSRAVGQLDSGHHGRSEGFESRYARIIEPENIEQVREFYQILFDLYKYKVKKPLPPWDFFESFYRISKEGRLGVIRLVWCEGKIIGGILSPVTPGKTIYEWYVCGLDQLYKEIHPSVLATWAALEYAVEHNIPRFDFMGVGIPEREYGVREFKSRFGGEMVNFGRFARVNHRIFYTAAEAGYNLLALLKKI